MTYCNLTPDCTLRLHSANAFRQVSDADDSAYQVKLYDPLLVYWDGPVGFVDFPVCARQSESKSRLSSLHHDSS